MLLVCSDVEAETGTMESAVLEALGVILLSRGGLASSDRLV